MEVTIKGPLVEPLAEKLKKVHADLEETPYYARTDDNGRKKRNVPLYKDCTIDLTGLTKSECLELYDDIFNSGLPGTRVPAADIKKYLDAEAHGVEAVRARTCRQAAWMLERYFAGLKHKIIFSEDKWEGNSYVGYFIDDIDFEPAKKGRRDESRQPAEIHVSLRYVEGDRRHSTTWTISEEEVEGRTCLEMLRQDGYLPESDQLMENLAKETERFYEVKKQIGRKFKAVGKGRIVDDEGATTKRDRWGTNDVVLNNYGLPSSVVVDVVNEAKESDDEGDDRQADESNDHHYGDKYRTHRWHEWNSRFFKLTDDNQKLIDMMEADEDTVFGEDFHIPVHPLVTCFDLKRHNRMKIHVNNLTEHVYDPTQAMNLVLPKRDWEMINLLVDESANTFRDIVEGKGQSMAILSEGPPGTGKTATAEVFAEFKERALYSVQCSQLGMEVSNIEKNLAIVLRRASRWNAVLLLDEADVYIRKRGNDVRHNAIVGVFLRLLEYSNCIMFMTTNLPEDVDDAIASRCIARLSYSMPTRNDQKEIWKKLAELNGIVIAPETIDKFATDHELSGRDVKQLLKLASFISKQQRKPITYDTLSFALQFRPARSNALKSVTAALEQHPEYLERGHDEDEDDE